MLHSNGYSSATYTYSNPAYNHENSVYLRSGTELTITISAKAGYRVVGLFSIDGTTLVNQGSSYTMTVGNSDISFMSLAEPDDFIIGTNPGVDVIYNSDDEIIVTYSKEFKMPKAYKQGHKFLGWKCGGDMITDAAGNSIKEFWYTEDIIAFPVFEEDKNAPIFLAGVADFLAIKDAPNGNYCLTGDIDLSAYEWTPFEFSGTLLGDGFTVSGINLSSDEGNLGFFATVSGKISNISFVVDISSAAANSAAIPYVGGLCVNLTGTLENVKMYGSVSGIFANAGGLVGKVNGGKITNCKNYAEVSASTLLDSVSIGGIAAILSSGNVTGCENYGEISGQFNVGGVVGYTSVAITNLTNYGNVQGATYVGGCIGRFKLANTSSGLGSLTNSGEVKGTDYVGGCVGQIYLEVKTNDDDSHPSSLGTLENSGNVSGASRVGGCIGHLYANGTDHDMRKPKMSISIKDVTNSGNVSASGNYVGGIIGFCYSDSTESNLTNATSSGAVRGNAFVGAIAGRLDNVALNTASNEGASVKATGYVIEDKNNNTYLGGLVGYGYSLKDCTNKIPISANGLGNYIGGVAGYITGVANDCHNEKYVYANTSECVGGIAGALRISVTKDKSSYICSISNLSNAGQINGVSCVGGIFGDFEAIGENFSQAHTATVTMYNLKNEGSSVTVFGTDNIGGIIGRANISFTSPYGWNVVLNAHFEKFASNAPVQGAEKTTGALIGKIVAESGKKVSGIFYDHSENAIITGYSLASSAAVNGATATSNNIIGKNDGVKIN